jgi:hypothetical protein
MLKRYVINDSRLTLNCRVLGLLGSSSINRVHPGELSIEGRQGQETTGHTHIVSITGESRAHDQHDRSPKEGIASKAQIWLQAHDGGDIRMEI